MNYTQNEKIEQVTDSTMVVGVDIGSQIHYARAFDNRGRELTKRIFSFHNDLEGFNSFSLWAETLKTENKKIAVLIRDLVYSRDGIMKQHNISANRIQRWLAIHFPEYLGLYTRFDAISGLTVLEKAPLPKDVIALGVNGIRKIWHDKKMRGRGVTEDRAKTLVEAAHNSVGLDGGIGTKSELYMLLEEHRLWTSQLEAVNKVLEEMILKVPHVEKLLAIKGVGSITIAGFIAEVGDIRRFDSPKQIQKYAGLELVENSSGKHKGRTRISKRGRRKLGKFLYQVMVPLLARNKEFRGIYDYYVTRVKNPLKRRQAMVAVSCKLIRVFYAVLTKGVEYDRFKMMSDIHRKSDIIAA